MSQSNGILLNVKNVTKEFGGLRAVSDVSFELHKGQILGLIGPNGAGKTTLFNCINGVFPPTRGKIIFRDTDISGWQPYDVVQLGMARTHQIVRPLQELTVLENVMAGACYGHEQHSVAQARDVAEEVLEFVRLDGRRDQLAKSLNVAQKKRLELARALAARPHLMLLDEVLAGLNQTEISEMVQVVLKIREQGVTILIIEHVMHALMNVSDRVIVLDHGELIAAGTPDEIVNNSKVIEAYLGDPKLAERLMNEGEEVPA
ncbi:MAG TPA: ABC transporter ATP-binding protein [Anaerolineae bacterium]|nr:ABC transporter ATP-binding protein [Anaerolineae bacterium]